MKITDEQWSSFEENGYLVFGKVLEDEGLKALQERIDEIMLGKAAIDYSKLLMQLDSTTGKYEDAPEQSNGFKGSSLAYRKIQNLEFDPLFLEFLEEPVYKDACDRVYGPETPITCFRAMFMNKPAKQGTLLPWHQDAWNYLSLQPLLTAWTALDPATKANGCVAIIPRTHKLGLINPSHTSGFLSSEQAEDLVKEYGVEYLELEPGESMILHNWLVHGSDINRTDVARRAFSVCYMDAATNAGNGEVYTPIFSSRVGVS